MAPEKDEKEEEHFHQKSKGITKAAQKGFLFEHYYKCMFGTTKEELIQTASFWKIGSKHHNVRTELITKVALSAFDDKRLVEEDKITTHAIGYNKK